MREYPIEYIVWDLETTGLSHKNSNILEIGMSHVHGGEVLSSKSWLLKTRGNILPIITDITGITTEEKNAEGQDQEKALEEFLGHISNSHANVTHNGFKFDIPFLIGEVDKFGLYSKGDLARLEDKLFTTGLDTAVMVKADKLGMKQKYNETFRTFAGRVNEIIRKGVKYNLKLSCEERGIEMGTAHRALGDVESTLKLYKSLTS